MMAQQMDGLEKRMWIGGWMRPLLARTVARGVQWQMEARQQQRMPRTGQLATQQAGRRAMEALGPTQGTGTRGTLQRRRSTREPLLQAHQGLGF